MDIDTMITTYNTAGTDTACKILGTKRCRIKPWAARGNSDLCDNRRDFKKRQCDAEGAKEYSKANKRIQTAVKKPKADWIAIQCVEIKICLHKKLQQESLPAGEETILRETE
ncbi:MAG: hypothetical protein AB2693_13560 [Candidatus Thiodiazotropha sp.]